MGSLRITASDCSALPSICRTVANCMAVALSSGLAAYALPSLAEVPRNSPVDIVSIVLPLFARPIEPVLILSVPQPETLVISTMARAAVARRRPFAAWLRQICMRARLHLLARPF
jgi:hypothetical protein